jgi:hypothetical protein
MNIAIDTVHKPETIANHDMQYEWRRIEILANCLLLSRAGKQVDEKLLQELKQIQATIENNRQSSNSSWASLPMGEQNPLIFDVLAAIYACEVRPQIAWVYQELQSAQPSPYPCVALLQQLLALRDDETQQLLQLTASYGVLRKDNLIEADGEGAFAPLRANKKMLTQLMQWPAANIVPPGAYPVSQHAHWQDLILPKDRERMIREYMLWITHRDTVVNKWGGQAMGGPVALFSGPSGTGKTFAAIVIASELKWPLFRVDLGRLVSKYIGETEKNIGRLFDAAHGQQMVLQFDEVDSLMSKRGDIKEARDRYANMEVSYLLARIEDHHGPCILTTNLRTQIDKAFSRRFQMVVEFPRPDQSSRERLWRQMLPPNAPLAKEVDTQFLAESVNLTGGNIRNAALHAAYLAAEANCAIDHSHIAVAVYRELAKDRAQLSLNELGKLCAYLPQSVLATAELNS